MGNRCCPTSIQILDCIHQLQDVEKTLQQLINKYDEQILTEKKKILPKIRDKSACMVHLRTIHIIKFHKRNLENRLTSCMEKRYHLESLNVTKMQVKAIKTTTLAFSSFLKQNDIERVEALQDNITDMIDQACEINEVLTRETTTLDLDESELEQEYQQLILQDATPFQEMSTQEMSTQEMLSQLPEIPAEVNPKVPLLGEQFELVPLDV